MPRVGRVNGSGKVGDATHGLILPVVDDQAVRAATPDAVADSTRKSFLDEALRQVTPMPVTEVQDETKDQTNHVCVIPADADISIQQGVLTLMTRANARARMPGSAMAAGVAGHLQPTSDLEVS